MFIVSGIICIVSVVLQNWITKWAVNSLYPTNPSFTIGLLTAFISAVVSFGIACAFAHVTKFYPYITCCGIAIISNFALSPFITKSKIKGHLKEQETGS